MHVDERLNECEYGEWSNRKLEDLRKEDLWQTVMKKPSAVRFPGGESMAEMQSRAIAAVEFWKAQIDEVAVLASHGDVIKSIIAHYAGIEFDDFQKIQVAPASITRIEFTETDAQITPLNYSSRDEVGGGDSEQADSRI